MQIDFTDLVKKSFKFTLKYKILWVYGFILAFFQAFSNFSSRSDRSNNTSLNAPDNFNQAYNQFNNFFSSPLVIVAVVVIAILITLLSWYLSRISTSAISRSVLHDSKNDSESIKFGLLWNEANSIVLKVMLFDFVWGFSIGLLTIAVIVPFVFLTFIAGPIAVLLLCCGLIFLVPVLIVLSVINRISNVLIVNYNYGLWESVTRGWELIRKEFGNILIYTLLTFLLAIPFIVIVLLIGFVLGLAIVLPVILLMNSISNTVVIITLVIIAAILFAGLFAAALSPFTVFFQVLETKFVHAIEDKLRMSTSPV